MLKLLRNLIAIKPETLILPGMTTRFTFALTLVITAFLPIPAFATDADGETEPVLILPADKANLSDFIWKKRPIVVFADSENDPAFVEQLALIQARKDDLLSRDVIVLTDTVPGTLSPLRKKLRPRGFMLVIMSKEGRVQLRKPFPWNVREITRSIDKLPIRQREIRDAKFGEQ